MNLRQKLAFKKTLLQFGRELTEEADEEYLASVYHEESEELQIEINVLAHKVAKLPPEKKVTKKATKKKVSKKRGLK